MNLHTSITINFMPPRYTTFAPDWCFGLLKHHFRRTPIHCLDLCNVVCDSTPDYHVNIPLLSGREDSFILVPTFDRNYWNCHSVSSRTLRRWPTLHLVLTFQVLFFTRWFGKWGAVCTAWQDLHAWDYANMLICTCPQLPVADLLVPTHLWIRLRKSETPSAHYYQLKSDSHIH